MIELSLVDVGDVESRGRVGSYYVGFSCRELACLVNVVGSLPWY